MTAQSTSSHADPVRLALVGCGIIAGAHVEGYKDLFNRGCREFVVTACVDVREENARQRAAEIAQFQGTEPQVFSNQEQLVQARLADAADLCLPHCFHHTSAIPLLEAGLHVMVEKPIGITIKASKAIIAAAERCQRILATGEQVRRFQTARAFAWAIKERRLLGDMRFANVQSIGYWPFDYQNPAMQWRGIKLLTGGGMIMDSGAHFSDMIQVLFGEPDEAYCVMRAYDNRMITGAPVVGDVPTDVEDTWQATLQFKSGVLVSWTHSRSMYGDVVSAAHYYGSAGTIQSLGFAFHPFQDGGNAVLADGTKLDNDQIVQEYLASLPEGEKERLFPYGATEGIAIEVWDFVNAVATGRKPEMDGYAGLRAKALCETCFESAIAGRPVKYDDVLAGRVDAFQRPIDEFWKLA